MADPVNYKQAALELNAEIQSALYWIQMGAEPSVAHAALKKTSDRWTEQFIREEVSNG